MTFSKIAVSILAALLLCASPTQAQEIKGPRHVVHLKAGPKMETWRTKHRLSAYRSLWVSVYVNGHEITGRGGAVSKCRWLLVTSKLSVDISNCGGVRAPITLRYSGSTRFTFAWQQGGY